MKPQRHPDTEAFAKFLIDNAVCVELFKGMKKSHHRVDEMMKPETLELQKKMREMYHELRTKGRPTEMAYGIVARRCFRSISTARNIINGSNIYRDKNKSE